ncbi:hypothetical protein [Marinococcus halotolerans]|jgi:hypothetical protein|nr:hypothetical protein [Marinococcus halotolerans]
MTKAYTERFYTSLEIDRMINEGGHVDEAYEIEPSLSQETMEKELYQR